LPDDPVRQRADPVDPTLISACGSPRMLAAQSDLYDQPYRYRRLMMAGSPDPEVFLAEHDRLADLALRRREPEAGAALESHIASTLRHVYPETESRSQNLPAADGLPNCRLAFRDHLILHELLFEIGHGDQGGARGSPSGSGRRACRALRATLAASAVGIERVKRRPASQSGSAPSKIREAIVATVARMAAARNPSSTNSPMSWLTIAPIMRARPTAA
jgi:hypothetical protein